MRTIIYKNKPKIIAYWCLCFVKKKKKKENYFLFGFKIKPSLREFSS